VRQEPLGERPAEVLAHDDAEHRHVLQVRPHQLLQEPKCKSLILPFSCPCVRLPGHP
jgi:hypothetical protein